MNTDVNLKVKLFADGAEKQSILELYANPLIQGFTTNPTLMRKVECHRLPGSSPAISCGIIRDRPISFEVFADDFQRNGAAGQADRHPGDPTSTYEDPGHQYPPRVPPCPLVNRLSHDGVKLNVTALLTLEQVRAWSPRVWRAALRPCISVFAGRIADTGVDPGSHHGGIRPPF